MPAAAGRAGQPIPAPISRPRPTGRSGSWADSGHQVSTSTFAFNLTSGPMPRVTRSFDRRSAGASLTGSLLSPTSEKLDPHVLTSGVGGVRSGRRPIFSTVERSVGIACSCAHTDGGGVGARCGDRRPGFADLRKARSVLTYWRGRAATDFLDRREKRRHRVPLRAHSRRGRRSAVR